VHFVFDKVMHNLTFIEMQQKEGNWSI